MPPLTPFNRRKFIGNGLTLLGGTALLTHPALGFAKNKVQPAAGYTVQQIIDIIIKDIPGAPFAKTVDTIKYGSADAIVTGIVTTMFPTVPLIEKAVALNANLIIAHEPTYYNGQDNLDFIPNNKVVKQKQALLEKHGITIWRYHDYCHRRSPDMVQYGVAKKMNWQPYFKAGERMMQIPSLPLKELVKQLKKNLHIQHLRVIGDLNHACSSVCLLPGAVGAFLQLSQTEQYQPDVLIVGEQVEWETTEYIRDTLALGNKTALIVLGHSVSEEPVMEELVTWLQPKLTGITVTNIPSGDPFTWL